jgi:hypothetical protein
MAEGLSRVQSVSRPALLPAVAAAYDASNVTFRVLRAFGWGPLLNLGYYPFGPPLTLFNFLVTPFIFTPFFRLAAAQVHLVKKARSAPRSPRPRRRLWPRNQRVHDGDRVSAPARHRHRSACGERGGRPHALR